MAGIERSTGASVLAAHEVRAPWPAAVRGLLATAAVAWVVLFKLVALGTG